MHDFRVSSVRDEGQDFIIEHALKQSFNNLA